MSFNTILLDVDSPENNDEIRRQMVEKHRTPPPILVDTIPGTKPPLPYTAADTLIYKEEQGRNLSFFNMFSGEGNRMKYGIVSYAMRYRIVEEDGIPYQHGVVVRLSAVILSEYTKLSLTIPNFAAAGELGLTQARIMVSAAGYTGPVAHLLPGPAELNVENYGKFMETFMKLQAAVLDANQTGEYEEVRVGIAASR